MATDQDISDLVTAMEELYPHREKLSDAALKLWCATLSDIPIELLAMAAKDHITLSKWFPTIAEFRALATSYVLPKFPTPMEAWGEVHKQIQTVGHAGQPVFSHPVIEATVKHMGWRNLCLSESGSYDRHAFMEAYEQMVSREIKEAVRLPEVKELAKKLEATNGRSETPALGAIEEKATGA